MLVPTRTDTDKTDRAPRRLVILGSTGSIGVQALDLLRQHPARFSLLALCAGSNSEAFLAQVREFRPVYAALADKDAAADLRKSPHWPAQTELLAGDDAICSLAALPEADVVLAAIVGFAGLPSVLSAVRAGKLLALANKESLVCGGQLVSDEQARSSARIIPVDSEHSALFQSLEGHHPSDIQSLILTASGGPFLNTSREDFASITPAQALKHPRWTMGAKITIDSATLVNKGLELIEAAWLFSIPPERIEVVIHPQSIVHSLVRFKDGAQIAQLGLPDMKVPIAYALNYPDGRLAGAGPQLDLCSASRLDFMAPDDLKFPAIGLARQALLAGGDKPAVYNIANEIAVSAFLAGRIGFSAIISTISDALGSFGGGPAASLEELFALKSEIEGKLRL